MTTEKLSQLEQSAADAVQNMITKGNWNDNPVLAKRIAELGISAIEKRDEWEAKQDSQPSSQAAEGEIDEQGWISEPWAAWRVTLTTGDNPSVVYFSRKPTYAECKAFARAAGIPADQAIATEREE